MARLTAMRPVGQLAAACAGLALAGCALAPQSKTFYLSREDWSGVRLSSRGRITVADAVAGAAPNTVTHLNVGALGAAPPDPLGRARTQDARARAVAEALARLGVPPADIAFEARRAEAPDPLWPPPQPMVIVVRY